MLPDKDLMNILLGVLVGLLTVATFTLAVWNGRAVYRKQPRTADWRVAQQLNRALQLVELALDNLRYGSVEGRSQHLVSLREGLHELDEALIQVRVLKWSDPHFWEEARTSTGRVLAALVMGQDNRALLTLLERAQHAVDHASDRTQHVLAEEEEPRNVAWTGASLTSRDR